MIKQLKEAVGSAIGDQRDGADNRWLNFYRSALLLLVGVMVSVVAWEGERVIGRLDGIEKTQTAAAVAAADTNRAVTTLTSDVRDIKQVDRDQYVAIGGLDHRVTILESARPRGH